MGHDGAWSARHRPASSDVIARCADGAWDRRQRDTRRLARELDVEWMSVVQPGCDCTWIGRAGTWNRRGAGAVIQPDTRIGRHAIINTGATVDHDCTVGSFVHIAPGVHLCGAVQVGEGTLIGVGASAIPGVSIGAWSVVGGGACCVRDIPDHSMAKGVPARVASRS